MIVVGETLNSGSPPKLNPPPCSLKLEMHKNLAKLKRSPVRINRNKQKGKNTIKEKTTKIKNLVVVPPGFEPAPQTSSSAKIEASYRWAMRTNAQQLVDN